MGPLLTGAGTVTQFCGETADRLPFAHRCVLGVCLAGTVPLRADASPKESSPPKATVTLGHMFSSSTDHCKSVWSYPPYILVM